MQRDSFQLTSGVTQPSGVGMLIFRTSIFVSDIPKVDKILDMPGKHVGRDAKLSLRAGYGEGKDAANFRLQTNEKVPK